jgi:hypothetical protein
VRSVKQIHILTERNAYNVLKISISTLNQKHVKVVTKVVRPVLVPLPKTVYPATL